MSMWQIHPKAPPPQEDDHPWSLVEAVVIAIGLWAAAMVGIAESGILPR